MLTETQTKTHTDRYTEADDSITPTFHGRTNYKIPLAFPYLMVDLDNKAIKTQWAKPIHVKMKININIITHNLMTNSKLLSFVNDTSKNKIYFSKIILFCTLEKSIPPKLH